MLKSDSDKEDEVGKYLFWVKDTSTIFRYDLINKKEEIVGKCNDAIIAFSVGSRNLRQKDRELVQGNNDQEAGFEIDDETFYVTCIDESQIIHIFTNKDSKSAAKLEVKHHQVKLRDVVNIPNELKNKDMFGMGYPYHVKFYGEKMLACSSDYGVLFMQVDGLT